MPRRIAPWAKPLVIARTIEVECGDALGGGQVQRAAIDPQHQRSPAQQRRQLPDAGLPRQHKRPATHLRGHRFGQRHLVRPAGDQQARTTFHKRIRHGGPALGQPELGRPAGAGVQHDQPCIRCDALGRLTMHLPM